RDSIGQRWVAATRSALGEHIDGRARVLSDPSGGRTWWAHFEFTRINITPTIHARSGRDVSINAVYTTLDRLESKGFLKSWVGDPTPQRGGRRRKFYALRPAGVAALRQAYRAFTTMADGLQGQLELK